MINTPRGRRELSGLTHGDKKSHGRWRIVGNTLHKGHKGRDALLREKITDGNQLTEGIAVQREFVQDLPELGPGNVG